MKDRIKAALLYAWYFCKAYVWNRFVEWRNDRLANKRRRWVAHRINGGGVVPLGKVNRDDAIAKTAQFGNVAFVDDEVAGIFYHDKI